MKKIGICILLLIISGAIVFPVMTKAQTDAWIAILGEKTLQVRFDKLEEYYKTYGDKDERNAIYMYLSLAETSYQLQRFDKTIQYGEKVLLYKELEPQNKLRVYLFLANAYNLDPAKKDIDKAYSYAELVIELAKSLRLTNQSNNGTIDIGFVAPALRIQIQIMLAKSQDLQNIINAFNKSLESYQLDKSEKSAYFVLALSKRMIDSDRVEEAIRGIEAINQNKPSADYYKTLGNWYARLKNNVKAIENFKASYILKKNAQVGYNLGILLNQNQELDVAIEFLAESYLLNEEKYSADAQKLLQQLVFYEKTKGQPQAEQEKTFNDILAAAKTRLADTTPISSDAE